LAKPFDLHALPPAIAARAQRVAAQTGLELSSEARWVVGLSDFAAKVVGSQRRWFVDALAAGTFAKPPDQAGLEAELASVAEAQDMDGLKRSLRLVRSRRQFWIIWRHLLGLASLEETVGGLSLTADKLIDAALVVVERWELERHGRPLGESSQEPQRLFVLALGNVVSAAGGPGGLSGASPQAVRRRRLVDVHEGVHLFQNRLFGPLYALGYLAWMAAAGAAGLAVGLTADRKRLRRVVETFAYYDNPFEYWAYRRDSSWPPPGAHPRFVWPPRPGRRSPAGAP